jgi:hypothetical protein
VRLFEQLSAISFSPVWTTWPGDQANHQTSNSPKNSDQDPRIGFNKVGRDGKPHLSTEGQLFSSPFCWRPFSCVGLEWKEKEEERSSEVLASFHQGDVAPATEFL